MTKRPERKFHIRKKGNDKGFTLIEMIIAVVIFAVITIPVMQAFGTSAQLNDKARNVQNSNDAASSIAETINAADLEGDLHLKGTGESYTFDAATDTVALQRLFGADSVSAKDGSANPRVEADGSLTFQLYGVSSGGKKYDAIVTVDPHTSGAYGDDDYIRQRNAEKMTAVTNVSQRYVEPLPGGTAVTPLREAAEYEESSVLRHSRWIELDLSSDVDGDSGDTVVKMKITYHYNLTKNGPGGPATEDKDVEVMNQTIQRAPTGEEKDVNFYFFINPDYDCDDSPKERIVINNPNDVKGNVYIIKQKTEDLTASDENSYSARIDVKEDHPSARYVANMNIHVGTNIDQSIMDATKGNKLHGDYSLRYFYSDYYYNSSEMGGSFVSASDYNRLYEYNVKVYRATGASHIPSDPDADVEAPLYEIGGVKLR